MPNDLHPLTNADSLGLDHMRAFIAVVETGSQVQAAKRLRVAQTTVCRQIERVQEHFGGGLFERGASGGLSTRGALVEQALRTAMAVLSQTRDRLALEHPVLRIGFIRPVRSLLEAALYQRTKAATGEAFEVRLLELSSERQARALANRELDIAICYALPELAARTDIEASLVSEQPFALVIPERAFVRGKPSASVLATLDHVRLPRRYARSAADAGERWLRDHGIAPRHSLDCELGTEIVAYAAAGRGYGFLPALWSLERYRGVVFVAAPNFGVRATIAAYSLRHVRPWVTRLRQDLSAAARAALKAFEGG
jgi:DNA-binding transcriptional LysR family regulator